MPSMIFRNDNVAANAVVANILAGSVFEFVAAEAPVTITIYAIASAAGMRITATADSDIVINDNEIPFIGTTLLEDHLITEFVVSPGTRLTVTYRETAGVATTDNLCKVVIE